MTALTADQAETTADSFANGSILESRTSTISSDGAIITSTVSATVGTNLTFRFSDGLTVVDYTTPKTVTLTAGSDTVPQENYIYVLKSDPTTLVNNTTSFPSAEYAPIQRVIVQSASEVQSNGVLKQHAYTDHIEDDNDQGHMTHVNSWIRDQFSTWISGIAPTITGSGTGTVTYAVTSGIVKQLHSQTFPAIVNPADIYVINDSVTPYTITTNIGGGILSDAAGTSLANKYYNLVIWGVVSETGSGESKLFINLPSSSYNTQSQAEADGNKTANFSIPVAYKGVGFLIQQIVMRNQADTTFTAATLTDLRGQLPNTVAGTSIAEGTQFPDSTFVVFNNADNTKEAKLDVSGLTTATARTYITPDKNGTFALLDDLPVKKPFSFIATAGQTSFTLPTTPPTPTLVTTFRNGTQAIYGTNFTVSGDTLTWVAPTLFLNEGISGFYNDTGVSFLVPVTTKSASDTAALEDAEHIIEYTNGASDYAFTLPQNSDVAFPIGSWIEIRRTGSGEITITKGTGATFRGALGDVNVKIDGADGYSSFIEKTATNTWLISGSVKAV